DQALATYGKSRSKDETVTIENGRAAIYKNAGLLERSAKIYVDLIAMAPYIATSYCGLGDVRRLQGNLDAALAIYLEAKERFAFTPVPYSGAASVLQEMGRWDEAHEMLREGLRLFPDELRLAASL